MSIRSTAKALIINNGQILLNKCFDEKNGEYYALPGGGQHKYETLLEAVVRECKEETGYTVKPLKMAAVCEVICADNVFREASPEYAHKLYHIFICEPADEKRVPPSETDSMQISSEWMDMDKLTSVCILPQKLGERITDILNGAAPVFLGSDYMQLNHG